MTIHIIDFHTHRLDASAALISVDPRQFDPQPGRCYSLGLHPWNSLTIDDSETALTALEQHASHPQVLAIGETGMDTLRGADLDIQAQLYLRHLQLAHDLGKPVVVHMVRTARPIVDVRRRAGLTDVPLAIHGMRGNAQVARMLIDEGCYLSFGRYFNPTALMATPPDRLLIETDDSEVTILEVASCIAQTLGRSVHDITTTAADNARRLLAY